MKQTGSKSCPHSHEYSEHKQNRFENQPRDIPISHGSIWEEMGEGRDRTEISNPPIHLTLSNLKRILPQVYMPCPC